MICAQVQHRIAAEREEIAAAVVAKEVSVVKKQAEQASVEGKRMG